MTGIWSGISSNKSSDFGAGVDGGAAFSWRRKSEAGEPSLGEFLSKVVIADPF